MLLPEPGSGGRASEQGPALAESHLAPETATAPAQAYLAPVVMLRPIRTLVVARDLGFRQRALTVLGALGPVAFAVVPPAHVVALVRKQRPHVVVLDATGCAPEMPCIVAALYDVDPRVGVVVVSDQRDRVTAGARELPKWGWAADLAHAVQNAYHHGNPLKEDPLDVCS